MSEQLIISLLILFFIFVILIITVIVLGKVFFSLLIMSLFNGPYFAPSDEDRIKKILKIVKPKKGQKIIDLGSGDGRLVEAFAKKGAIATGAEINPFLICKSKRRLKKANLGKKAKILRRNFWKIDLSEYDVIVVYGIQHIMKKLGEKIKEEANKGTKVISIYFHFLNLKETKKIDDIHLYEV